MTADDTEATWSAFLAESEEHLDAVDRLLSRGGDGVSGDIAALFRGFHSLKGLSLAMDLANMQAVAHRAEDLLGLVRQGTAALPGAVAGTLLEAVDRLRGMREWVEAHRTDPPPDPDLVARLERAAAAASPPYRKRPWHWPCPGPGGRQGSPGPVG